jgi:hypothetical protein
MANRRLPDAPNPEPTPPTGTAAAPARARKSPTVAKTRVKVTAEARRALIAESAYLRAERRGFAPGHEAEDWLAAEAEIDALLRVEHGGSPQ